LVYSGLRSCPRISPPGNAVEWIFT
jgi:hypothetical protein